MNRNICLFAPRLDCTFKEGPVPATKDYANIPPIRQHWDNFVWRMIEFAAANNDRIQLVEVPLWQMYPQMVNMYANTFDIVLMPHKQRGPDFHKENIFFYMQTVLQERFTVDRNGWGANLSFLPLDLSKYEHDFEAQKFLNKLSKRIDANVSKFDQPPIFNREHRSDVLFVCQIPHDETIKYHSDISVEDTLRLVLADSYKKDYTVLVKGHPVNPASMAPLRAITDMFPNATWTDSMSIHEAIRACDVVAMVNSGVGFEAMIHGKQIYSYGRSEYQNVVHYKKAVDKNIGTARIYSSFLYEFFEHHTVDTSNQKQFNKVLGNIL